ncbi:hypothetical protein J6590_078237 [Homalodisca vitripennis]|nr:hypothetical protein J6590_078237 [Homalodisca vitripennis]
MNKSYQSDDTDKSGFTRSMSALSRPVKHAPNKNKTLINATRLNNKAYYRSALNWQPLKTDQRPIVNGDHHAETICHSRLPQEFELKAEKAFVFDPCMDYAYTIERFLNDTLQGKNSDIHFTESVNNSTFSTNGFCPTTSHHC